MTTHTPALAASSRTAAADLVDIVNLVAQAIFADLRASGHAIEPTQWATLRLLVPGPSTVSELARLKAVGLPTMSKSVDMLVRHGWVERCVDEADRRQTLVRLTDDGRQILRACRQRAEVAAADKLAALNPGDLETIAASLRRLREALQQVPGP